MIFTIAYKLRNNSYFKSAEDFWPILYIFLNEQSTSGLLTSTERTILRLDWIVLKDVSADVVLFRFTCLQLMNHTNLRFSRLLLSLLPTDMIYVTLSIVLSHHLFGYNLFIMKSHVLRKIYSNTAQKLRYQKKLDFLRKDLQRKGKNMKERTRRRAEG